ncbi:restriction endonuclease subunit S [Meiothermus cerbereus]|uniref:restriction endonuclease subunit S n=1 Tax=Meiothermus cerbereus TaxID=65552 RepID=UPI003EEF6EDA
MAGEWNKVTVGAFAPFAYGKGLPEHRRDSSGHVPVFGSNGVVGFHSEALTSGPTVVIGRKGTVGAVHYSPKPCWPIDTTFYVVDPDPCVLRFKYYLLKALGLEHMNADSAVPGLNRDAAHALKVSVPLLPEQRAIAHILGTLDDKLELNRRMSETLEGMARALFKSWFVDFEPVRAKMEGRWQRGQSLPGLPAHLYDLFPDRLVDSELGEIPEGWGVGCVDDEFDLTMGQSPPGHTYNEVGEGVPFYQGRTDFGFRFPTRRVYCTAPTRFAKKGDTLISVRAPVGDINMAAEDCAIGRGVAAARHKTGSRSYSYQFMRALEDVFLRFEAEGTVFGSIGKKDFHGIACVVPPRSLVEEFERRAAPLDSRIEVIDHESRTLAALRDALLPKLISGELRVKDAERFLEGRGL